MNKIVKRCTKIIPTKLTIPHKSVIYIAIIVQIQHKNQRSCRAPSEDMANQSLNAAVTCEVDDYSINYEKSLEYWADIPPTVDGVLGGFGFISNVDIDGSCRFLESLFAMKSPPAKNVAVDCGAGIGRITKDLLIKYFAEVDVVEPDEKFITAIRNYVGEQNRSRVCNLYKIGLQEFVPVRKYDVIWNQWVLGYLTDSDLFRYLEHCRNALNKNGIIVVKENVTSSGNPETDETDSSVTRSLKQFLRIFKDCNLKIIKRCKQTNFPNGIYPVYMFALVPDQTKEDSLETS